MQMRHMLLAVFLLGLTGCQTAADGLTNSAAPTDLTGPAASAIAGDLAGRFAEQAGSTATPIRLHRDSSEFAVALEAALRGWGYTVVTNERPAGTTNAAKPLELAYSLASSDGQVLARLSTNQLELGRAYTVSNGMAAPASPLSLMKRN
jgi:hypothetical protein